jgi:protocatechuate 3,4-dioxygenase beta subunit
MNRLSKLTRRGFLLDSGMVAAAWELSRNAALAQELKPTLSCRDGDEPTLRQGEGPFFKPKSPQRSDLREPSTQARPAKLSGFVLTRSCRPLPGAVVDLWHADEKGEYDDVAPAARGTIMSRFRRRAPVCSPPSSIFPMSRRTHTTACSSANY